MDGRIPGVACSGTLDLSLTIRTVTSTTVTWDRDFACSGTITCTGRTFTCVDVATSGSTTRCYTLGASDTTFVLSDCPSGSGGATQTYTRVTDPS